VKNQGNGEKIDELLKQQLGRDRQRKLAKAPFDEPLTESKRDLTCLQTRWAKERNTV